MAIETYKSSLGIITYMSGDFENGKFTPTDETVAKWLLLQSLGHNVSLHEVRYEGTVPENVELGYN